MQNDEFNRSYLQYLEYCQIMSRKDDQNCLFESVMLTERARGNNGPIVLNLVCPCNKCSIKCSHT